MSRAVSSASNEESISESVKNFLADKDWKFYAAVSASVVVAGAGVWYWSQCTKDQKKDKKPKKSTGSDQKQDAKSSRGQPDAIPPQSNEVDYETLPTDKISSLSEKERFDAAQLLKTKGNTVFGAKDFNKAIQLYTQAIAFKPDPIFYSNRAACYSNLHQYDEVIEDCTEALKMDPMYVKALNRRAQAYEKKSKYQEALHDFTAVCIVDGLRNETASAAMERLLKKVSEEKTKELIQTRQPRLPAPSYMSAYLDSFRPDKEELGPTEGESGDAYYAKARVLLKEKKFGDALDALNKAVELGCTQMAKALNLRGTMTFLKGNAKDALEDFNKAIELDPKCVQTFIKRASIYMEQRDPLETFNQFEEAIKINPNDPDIYYHRGQVYFLNGELDKAAEDYARSIELDNTFIYAHIQLGVAQYKMGSVPEAMATFEKTLQQFPQSADVHNYYGELLYDQHSLFEALQKFKKAIELDPLNPLPYVNKSLLVFQYYKEAPQAEELCQKALEVDPSSDVAIATLAQLLLQQGKTGEAIKYLEKSVELARTPAEIETAISYLEAARSQVAFAEKYPAFAEKLAALKSQ